MIPFNRPYLTGKEKGYMVDALQSQKHCGNHAYTAKCSSLLKSRFGFKEIFFTPSCTSALEMGAILADIGPGDEVILPSYTFSSTANAIVLRGASPVFCEIEENTMNISPREIEKCMTKKTKMILPIDYAGIPCEIDEIMALAEPGGIAVMEDAAQSLNSFYNGNACGALPDLSAFSFHETKNYSCGEGGALVVNNENWIERAHFLQEKGTDRTLVLKGIKSKYHWVDLGSSFLLSDILAAMLLAQLEEMNKITELRGNIVHAYKALFSKYENRELLKTPHPPMDVRMNHHAFFVIFDREENQKMFLQLLKEKNIHAYIGYQPLHSSPMGRRLGYRPEDLPLTESVASRIVRLPLYCDMQNETLAYCLYEMEIALKTIMRNLPKGQKL